MTTSTTSNHLHTTSMEAVKLTTSTTSTTSIDGGGGVEVVKRSERRHHLQADHLQQCLIPPTSPLYPGDHDDRARGGRSHRDRHTHRLRLRHPRRGATQPSARAAGWGPMIAYIVEWISTFLVFAHVHGPGILFTFII